MKYSINSLIRDTELSGEVDIGLYVSTKETTNNVNIIKISIKDFSKTIMREIKTLQEEELDIEMAQKGFRKLLIGEEIKEWDVYFKGKEYFTIRSEENPPLSKKNGPHYRRIPTKS